MTLEASTSRAQYATNGTTGPFTVPFYFLDSTHLQVTYTDADGDETTLVLTTDYSVTGAGVPAGGTVTTVVAYASGGLVTIVRSVPKTQLTDYEPGDAFPASAHEQALDKLTMIAQELDERTSRAIVLPVSDGTSVTLPVPEDRLDKFFVFDPTTGAAEVSTVTHTQVASAVAAAYGSGSTADAVTHLPAGTGAVALSVQAALRLQPVSVVEFGAVGDGVTDDTEAVRAAHTYANSISRAVTYRGVTSLAIDADAQIDVNTDVDFAGCTFVLLNGIVGSPSFSAFNVLFSVTDPLTPLTAAVDALTGTTQLKKGNRFPTLGAFDGPGYALLTCTGFTVPDRAKTSTQAYTQSFKVFRNGECQHPISVDLSSDSATVSVQYRLNSARPIELKNAVFPADGWNNQVLFDVNRNEVYFDRIMAPQDADTADYLSVDSLIFVHDCSDIYINHFEGVARNHDISQAGYNLNIEGGANVQVIGMQALNGWGAVGTNNINGMYFSRSTVNRVDVHSSGHNVFVHDCDIHRIGIVYGWGGGIWSIKNCRIHRCFALTNRSDYGGTLFGHIVISDIEVHHDGTQTYVVCSLETLGASTDVHAPETITIRGVKRYGAPATPGSASAIDVLRLAVATPASQVVYAPDEITISDISSFAGWRFGSKIDILNMEAHEASVGRLRINLSGIHADTIAQTTTGLVEYANARTPTDPIQPYVKAVDVQNLYVSFTPDVEHEILCHSCDVNGINADVGNTFQPYVELRDCRFRTPVSGVSPAPLGGTTSSGTGHTILSNCKVYSANFDFQYIAAASGCLVASGLSPTLPGGVAIADLFSGYVKAATFA